MKQFGHFFLVPGFVLIGIIAFLLLASFGYETLATIVVLIVIFVGSIQLVVDTAVSIFHREFALDYIAILAITVGLVSGQYIVAAVIVLMMSGGNALEEYGLAKAKESLTGLVDRIPQDVSLIDDSGKTTLCKRQMVAIGQHILVKKGEVLPLDGFLIAETALIDESSLTGEPYPSDKQEGSILSSGTVNIGDAFVMEVTKKDEDSVYSNIIKMVQEAQEAKSPFIRLADKYSVVFTFLTLLIAGIAYAVHRDVNSVLAVLVIATPCPLILATPIALMGGMSSSAKKLIIVKNLAAIESLARVNAIMFDKTGTITLGKPEVTQVHFHTNELDSKESATLLSIAAAIENNSFHPLAKAIVSYVKSKNISMASVTHVKETIGNGIQGTFKSKEYSLGKRVVNDGMSIDMRTGETLLATFSFSDQIKPDSKEIIDALIGGGLQVSIYTGDHLNSANKIANKLHDNITVVANCTPEDKQAGIVALHQKGKVVAMVGDGINDAPALALADVGMVFSHNEHTATTESADIVFLAGSFRSVLDALTIAQGAVRIAKESILFGIGLSLVGMILAAIGLIPPVAGAGIQELIDIIAILNALRASRLA